MLDSNRFAYPNFYLIGGGGAILGIVFGLWVLDKKTNNYSIGALVAMWLIITISPILKHGFKKSIVFVTGFLIFAGLAALLPSIGRWVKKRLHHPTL